MAKLPGYDSQQRMTTEAPVVARDVAVETQLARDLQVGGKAAQKIAAAWQEAKDFSETLAEENKMSQGVGTILNEMKQDPAHDNPEIYKGKLEELKSGIGDFSNNQARIKFDQYANTVINKANITVDGEYRKRMVDYTKGNLLESERNAAEAYKANPDAAQAAAIKMGYAAKIQTAKEKGFLTEVYYQERIGEMDKWDAERQDNLLQELLNADPDLAEAALTKGRFKDMSADDKAGWLKVIESAKKQRQKEIDDGYKMSTDAKNNEMTKKFFNDELTVGDLKAGIEEDEKKGGPNTKLLLQMREKLYTGQKARLETIKQENPKQREFIQLTQSVLADKKIDLMRAREILIDAVGDGTLSNEEAALLDSIKLAMKDMQYNAKTDWVTLGYKKIKEWTNKENKPTAELAEDIRQYLYGIAKEGSDPMKVAEEITQRRADTTNPEYVGWEPNKPYESMIGTVKFMNKDSDGMAIVERLNVR